MMDFEPFAFFKYLCIAVLCGIAAPLIYDLIKCILGSKNKIVTFVLDCFFALFFSIIFILILYYACDGKIRGVIFVALCLGAVIYLRLFRGIFTKLINTLLLPIKRMLFFFINIGKKVINFFVQAIAKKRSKLYNKSVK